MWQIHHSITTMTLLNEKPLLRWLTPIVALHPKNAGQPKIHRLYYKHGRVRLWPNIKIFLV